MNARNGRLAEMLKIEISEIIRDEIKDEDIKFVTLNHINLAPDLSYAKIFCTTLDDKNRDKVLKDLNGAKGFIKNELCKRKLSIRQIPELEFVYDKSIEEGYKIDKILRDINKK